MYKKATGNGLNYQSVGSGAGIKQIKAKTVDFGASDMPLKAAELEEAGLMQFPAIMGGVVTVVNLACITPGQLKLTGPVVADIYLGKITKWNDQAIAALNPGVKLPADDITVVHRADSSGTSFLFTDYLSKTNAGLQDQDRRRHRREMGHRRGRQGQRRRRRQRPAHQGLDRLRRVGLRQEEQDVAHPAEEQGRPSCSRTTTPSRPPPPTPTGPRPRASAWS
jgi:ABC-type phosphate transport system substrate-binding protein